MLWTPLWTRKTEVITILSAVAFNFSLPQRIIYLVILVQDTFSLYQCTDSCDFPSALDLSLLTCSRKSILASHSVSVDHLRHMSSRHATTESKRIQTGSITWESLEFAECRSLHRLVHVGCRLSQTVTDQDGLYGFSKLYLGNLMQWMHKKTRNWTFSDWKSLSIPKTLILICIYVYTFMYIIYIFYICWTENWFLSPTVGLSACHFFFSDRWMPAFFCMAVTGNTWTSNFSGFKKVHRVGCFFWEKSHPFLGSFPEDGSSWVVSVILCFGEKIVNKYFEITTLAPSLHFHKFNVLGFAFW